MAEEVVDSLEDQLNDMYAERSELVEALGTSNAGDILGMLRSLEEQVQDQYTERETLQQRLGISSSADLLNFVDSMDEQLRDLYAENESAVIVDGKSLTIVGAKKIIVRKSGQ